MSRSTTMSQSRRSDSSSTAPTSWSTDCASIELFVAAASWSSVDTASRNEPRAARAISDSAESCAWIPSPSATRRRSVTTSGSRGRWNTNVWQRERTVGEHLLQLGRAEDEDEVGRRLLDELEQCLPGRVRELVRLVEDVDLVAPLDGLEHDALADLADVVDPALRGGIHLDDVERGAVRDREADRAGLVRRRRRAGRAGAVQRLREDARHRRLPGSARPGEEVRLAHLAVLDRVLQRPDDRLLPDDLVESLRAVLPVERGHCADSIKAPVSAACVSDEIDLPTRRDSSR